MTINVDIFPEEHRSNIKDLLYNLADVQRQHKEACSKLLMSHRTKNTFIIDENSFITVEFYRLLVDADNLYRKYLVEHDLSKYLEKNA